MLNQAKNNSELQSDSSTGANGYAHSAVLVEGKLQLERVKDKPADGCERICMLKELSPRLCGLVTDEKGAANFACIEWSLEKLNSKSVRVTVEWDD